MLVLSRKLEEKIMVGDNITITVLKIRGNTVRIGIDAPREIAVVRGELTRSDNKEPGQPATVEFKSNGGVTSGSGPSIRFVTEDAEPNPDAEPEPAVHTNRLHQLVTQISMPDRQAQ